MKNISASASASLRTMLILLLLHLGLTVALVGWWGHVITQQSEHIKSLEASRPNSGPKIEGLLHVSDTARMVRFEGTWFLIVISISVLLIIGLFYRDSKRAKAIQTFMASWTHEFKTPLTSIRLQAESIADCEVDDEYLNKLIGRLMQDTGRLESQVERSLELARVEGGGKLFIKNTNLNPLMAKIVASWREQHSESVQVELDVITDEVQADPAAVQIIVKNLLDNSLKHGKTDDLKISIDVASAGNKLILKYRDNGQGISSQVKHLGRLFEKGPDSLGAGVGLYLVSALMKRMRGKAVFLASKGFEAQLFFKKVEVING